MILYPAIDLLDGRCVRLRQGRFDEATVYGNDPEVVAESYARAGAEAMHVVDLAGSRDGGATAAALIGRLARVRGLAVQVGGGIRSVAQAAAYVEAGVQRVVLGSVAARDPATALSIVRALGPDRITLALDLKPTAAGPALAVSGWTEAAAESPWDVLQRTLDAGVTHVLCTDVSRDGELAGPNVALYADLLGRWPKLRLQASGGVATLADLARLRRLGAAGAIVGKALYERRFALRDALRVAAGRDDPEDDLVEPLTTEELTPC